MIRIENPRGCEAFIKDYFSGATNLDLWTGRFISFSPSIAEISCRSLDCCPRLGIIQSWGNRYGSSYYPYQLFSREHDLQDKINRLIEACYKLNKSREDNLRVEPPSYEEIKLIVPGKQDIIIRKKLV